MVTCDENIRHRTDLPAVDGRIPGNYKSLLVSGGKSYSAVRNIPKKLERGAAAFLARFGSGRGSRSGLGLQGLGWVYVRALIPPSEVLPSSRTCPTPGKSILSHCPEDLVSGILLTHRVVRQKTVYLDRKRYLPVCLYFTSLYRQLAENPPVYRCMPFFREVSRTRLDFSRQKTRANRGIQNKYFKPVGLQIYPWQEILSFRRTNGIANIFFGSKFSAFVEPMGLQIFSTIGAATINFGSKSSVFVITDGTAKKKNVASSQLGRPPRQTQNVEP